MDNAKNTVVIFMSDHGEMLGDHGLTRKGCRFYEGVGACAPHHLIPKAGFGMDVRSGALVELIDIVPYVAGTRGT